MNGPLLYIRINMSSGASAALAEPYVAQNAFAGSDDIYVCDMGAFTDIATMNEFGGTKTSATVTALDFLGRKGMSVHFFR